jgi:hypothetical protein
MSQGGLRQCSNNREVLLFCNSRGTTNTHTGWHQVTTVQLPFHQIFSFRRFSRQLVSKCDGTAASHHEDIAEEEGATRRHPARPIPADYANSTRRPPARLSPCKNATYHECTMHCSERNVVPQSLSTVALFITGTDCPIRERYKL